MAYQKNTRLTPVGRVKQVRPKVVLYNPDAAFFTMPLSLVAIGSNFDPRSYEVVLVDGRLEHDAVAAVNSHLDNSICLGVTVLTGAPIRDAVRVSRAAKAHRPDIPIVWGGWHPSMFGLECLEEPSVDITVQGQGEATFLEIVDRLQRNVSLEGCKGCSYIQEGRVYQNAPRSLVDVNEFRSHDYGLIDVERYFKLKGQRQLDYISSQGCNFRCGFCADPFVYNRKWTGIEPARVVAEIYDLWKKHDFEDLSFQDETYFTRTRRVETIADEFIAHGLPITWAATMRADQCSRLPESVLAKCKQSGLRRVIIGVESGSQEMLDRIAKDIKLEQVFAAAERMQKYDIAVHFPFIVGFPEESDESVRASIDTAKRLGRMSPDFSTPFFCFRPYPGTSITHEAIRNGYTLPCTLDEWSTFDYVDAIGPWVSKEKYRLVERFKFYQELWRNPKWWQRPLRPVARWRLEEDRYAVPLEKWFSNWLSPPVELS